MTELLPEDQNWILTKGFSRRAAMAGAAAGVGYALSVQPVSATTITTDTNGIDAAMTQFASGDIKMGAYRARPLAKKNPPVIFVIQEVFGLHEWVRDICRRLAKAGYYAIAPDLYQRQGDATKATDFKQLFANIVSKVPDAQVMADLDALTRFVGGDGGDAARIGITGFCWGGRITWLYAAHNPKVKAGVAFYGRLVGPSTPLQPHNPIDDVYRVKQPVLGLYGALDKGITQADVAQMQAALLKAKSRSSITVFPGADHGFMADYRPSYNAAAATSAWGQALGWFKRYL